MLTIVGAIGCQAQLDHPSAASAPSFAHRVQAGPLPADATGAGDGFASRPADEGTREKSPGNEASAGTIPADRSRTGTTRPGANALRMLPRQNPNAEDLLDHWGHRNVAAVPGRIGLASSDDDGTTPRVLRSAAALASFEPVAPHLAEDDTVEVLGERLGVRYGRWTGGPADTLSIEFNFEHASEAMREDLAFRALVDRAGKAWSYQIADDWSTWHRPEGITKVRLIQSGNFRDPVPIAAGGEASTGVEIFVTENEAREGAADPRSRGGPFATRDKTRWEPHTGAIEFAHGMASRDDASIYFVTAHETGHVIGSWYGAGARQHFAPYIDRETGTWHGPNVLAVHGRPAPFQDRSDPGTSVDGERSPHATSFDFNHSGVCASIMAYCNSDRLSGRPPDPIDFAFLADLGMTVIDPTDRPETYGLGMWTDHAGAGVSVARTLRLGSTFDALSYRNRLETIDLLEARADAFGHRSTGDVRLSHGTDSPLGTARFAGGLLGTALELPGLPPVIGDANLEVDLDVLRGNAHFTSLAVFEQGTGSVFGPGALHYPFELSGNTLRGTRTGTSLRADFYGPRHEDVAGTLHDPFAGLLAGFAAATDARPTREDILLASDYVTGRRYRTGSTGAVLDGIAEYACTSRPSCRTRTAASGGYWSDWLETAYEQIVDETAGADITERPVPIADRGGIRVERQATRRTRRVPASPNAGWLLASHTVDGYQASMEHATFATGTVRYAGWTGDPGPFGPNFFEVWSSVHGTGAGSLPRIGSARWTGVMLGYNYQGEAGVDRHVHGTATIDYRTSTGTLDVEFANIESRDGKGTVDDIAFAGIEPTSEGNFRRRDGTGYIEGAIFGPAHEEAAGRFQNRNCSSTQCTSQLTGSFGGTGVPAAPTFEARGSVDRREYERADGTTEATHSFENWGLWGTKFGEDLFGAYIARNDATSVRQVRFEGTPSATNPAHGNAVWTGETRAFERRRNPDWFTPVRGDARLEANLSAGTIDVDLTGFERDHPDVSWDSVPLVAGAFERSDEARNFAGMYYGTLHISGKFYGPEHEGAAGSFSTPLLSGLFAAMRDP